MCADASTRAPGVTRMTRSWASRACLVDTGRLNHRKNSLLTRVQLRQRVWTEAEND